MKIINHTPKNVIRTLVAAAALCGALATGARAEEAPQVHVSYADLNLNTTAGATALYQRVRAAAAQVCALPVEDDLSHLSQTKACKARVIAEALTSLDNPTVTRVFEQTTGVTPAIQLAAR
jgi:UrcA family protein